MDAFWHPFRRLLGILGAFWPPSGCLFGILGAFWLPSGCLFGSLWKFFGPPRTCRDFDENFRELAEISPRTCRSSAENLPRFRRESAKNQPRTRRMNPKQSCLSHCALFEWTAFSDKRFDKIAENKSGAAVSPLGGLQLNNYFLNRPRRETGDFAKMSVSCTRELHFRGSWPSGTMQKDHDRWPKKRWIC